jgi:hypothetical protein
MVQLRGELSTWCKAQLYQPAAILLLFACEPFHTMGGDANNRLMPVSTSYPKTAAGPVGKQIHSIYESRLRQFTDGGQYREQGLLA